MAEIIYGFGTSHSPLLATKPEQWDLRAEADRQLPAHPYQGKTYSFDELVDLRKDENLAVQNKVEVRRERYDRCQNHLAFLSQEIERVAPDVLVIMGNDQREVFQTDHTPAFAVYHGDTVLNKALTQERLDAMRPGIAVSAWANVPEKEDVQYPGQPDLAYHIIKSVMADKFDVSASNQMPNGRFGENGIPHAFGFIYHRLMGDMKIRPVETVPIFVNTFFPPNQPSSERVLEFGKAVGKAIRSWDSDKKVAVAATGGFSHFVVDEEMDRRMFNAMVSGDEQSITSEPESNFQSGTSEIKNWIAAMGTLDDTGLGFGVIDYIPCYRSEAGTGNAMMFGTWT